jgi:hypothetical protein
LASKKVALSTGPDAALLAKQVRSCKGNEGIALIMTVGTNMLGVVRRRILMSAITSGYQVLLM